MQIYYASGAYGRANRGVYEEKIPVGAEARSLSGEQDWKWARKSETRTNVYVHAGLVVRIGSAGKSDAARETARFP